MRPGSFAFRPRLEELEPRLTAADAAAVDVAAGAMNVCRYLADPVRTGGLPLNEAARSALAGGPPPVGGGFVPAQLGNLLAAAALSNAWRQRDPTFTAGYSDAELVALARASLASLDKLLDERAWRDPATGVRALYQFHQVPGGAVPNSPFARTVTLLDNSQVIAGLHVLENHLRSLGPEDLDGVSRADVRALADRCAATLGRLGLRPWYDPATHQFWLGEADRPRAGVRTDRITGEGRLAYVAALARGEITPAEFAAGVDKLLAAAVSRAAESEKGPPPAVERSAFFGTALEVYAITPFVSSELRGPFGEGTSFAYVDAWKATAECLGVPAGGATGIATGTAEGFVPFGMSPAEVPPCSSELNNPILVPPAVAMMAGATASAPLPELRPAGDRAAGQLRDAVRALKDAGKFHPVFGAPNALDLGSGLVNDADPVYGFLETAEAALCLLNGFLGGTHAERLLNQDGGWFHAARAYQEALNVREAEFRAEGAGTAADRPGASGGRAWVVPPGDAPVSVTSPFLVGEPGDYQLVARYRNPGAAGRVTVLVGGVEAGSFPTPTRSEFADAAPVRLGTLAPGARRVTFRVEGGVELDRYRLVRHDLAVNDVVADEGGRAVFTISLTAPRRVPVTVNYATASGTARAGSDFTPATGTLTFAPGETVKTVAVAVAADAEAEPTETFHLDLTGASDGVTVSKARGTARVFDAAARQPPPT